MNLHEHQAKDCFRRHGIPVPEGRVADTPEAVAAACRALGGSRWMLKAQIQAGARGKAGGVRLATSPEEAGAIARALLGQRLVTPQTGPDGLPVSRLLVERPTAIARELYLGLLLDRASARVTCVVSPTGGVDIEAVAAAAPDRILREPFHPVMGPRPWQVRRLAAGLGLDAGQTDALGALIDGLHRLFMDSDATLVEVNPLVVTMEGALLALDAKLALDDNALFRHPDLAALRDPEQEDPRETQAHVHGLNYIGLDGDIGCMVNGAGLAMATLDLVRLHGGAPANFLDVGGGTTAARVAAAFKLILSDPRVRAVLVNIFGGIVRCDLIAEGIIGAVREVGVGVPIVVRLEGTNAERGRQLLADSGLALTTARALDAAADLAVAAARAWPGSALDAIALGPEAAP